MLDIPTLITGLFTSGIVGLAAARWLTTRLIDHRFTKDLKDHEASIARQLQEAKGHIDERLSLAKASIDAQLRLHVEESLGDQAAVRQYELEAKKRLYAAVGPLRFQLVMACADFAGRIERVGSGRQSYSMSLGGYFGQSTAFRLLRILATAELIERQMAYADFSVDSSTIDLLKFKNEAFLCLSSSRVSLEHPSCNWDDQVEHIFYDVLSMVAAAMIVTDAEAGSRVMRFDEFGAFVAGTDNLARIHPVPQIFHDFSVAAKPVFWVRLVCLAELCSALVRRDGPVAGVTAESFDGCEILRVTGDEFVRANHDRYSGVVRRFREFLSTEAG